VLPLPWLLVSLSVTLNAQGQQALEEVIVTAQKRSQSLQDVPISVSAVSGAKMESAGLYNLADLSAYVPNFQKTDTALGPVLLVRGIGSGVNQSFEQSVVQYSDEVAMGRAPLARMPFMDVERIEVLRGPQNVLFGKNSIGGALSVTTAKPSDHFEGRLSAEYEPQHEQQLLTAMVSGPLSDSLRGRLVARAYEEEGYFENTAAGVGDQGREESALRGMLSWDVTDELSAALKVERANFDSAGSNSEVFTNNASTGGPLQFLFGGLTYPEVGDLLSQITGQEFGAEDGQHDFKRATNVQEFSKIEANNVTLKLEGKFGDIEVTSVSGWLDYNTDELCDCDLVGIDMLSISQAEDYRQFSQEIRFSSPGGETIDWIAGVFYQQSELQFDSFSLIDDENILTALGAVGDSLGPLGAELSKIGVAAHAKTGRDYHSESDTYAVFSQGTWNISESLRLTLGARYTYEQKEASRIVDSINNSTGEFDLEQSIILTELLGGDLHSLGEVSATTSLGADYPVGTFSTHSLSDTRSEKSFTPSVVLEWDASEDALIYASIASGFKAGGFDARGAREDDFEYGNESVMTYEFGLKNRFADGRAELNAALFYTDYEDLQVSQFDGEAGFFVGNAPRAISQGVELDGRYQISDGLILNASLAYLDFEFKEYTGACPRLEFMASGERQCDYAGKRNIFTPEWSVSVGLAYSKAITDALTLSAGVDVNYVDDQYVEVTLYDPLKQDAYAKVNAQLGLKAERWSLSLIGRNLTDEDVSSYIGEVTLSGSNPIYAPSYSGFYERPRTVAIQGAYWF